jgi:putative hydrolase of HD superfamily
MLELDPAAIVRFIYELGQLQKENRNGWKRLGAEPESVAEHSLRAAQLAFVLAWLEGHPNPHEVCTLTVFHDVAETRASDLDKVHRQYTDAREEHAVREQTAELGEIGDSILQMWKDVEQRSTPAGTIAKDADHLEMAFKASELRRQGYADAQLWIDGIRDSLQTESARKLLTALEEADPNEWWKRVCGLM